MQSTLAPESINTVGDEPGTGIGVAMAGRQTPCNRPIRNNALAIVAPVLPALTMAQALPVPHRFGAAHQRGVALHTNGSTGVFVHLDDLAGRQDGNAGSSGSPRTGRVTHEKYGMPSSLAA